MISEKLKKGLLHGESGRSEVFFGEHAFYFTLAALCPGTTALSNSGLLNRSMNNWNDRNPCGKLCDADR